MAYGFRRRRFARPSFRRRAMPYRRKRRYAVPSYTRRIRKAYSKGNIRAGGVLKPELKWFDSAGSGTFGTTLAAIKTAPGTLNTIVQGNGSEQRIGDKVIIRSLQFKIQIRATGATAASDDVGDNIARVLIVIDHQCNGTIAAVGDILTTTTDTLSYREMTTTARFTILYDAFCVINTQVSSEAAGTALFGSKILQKSFYKKMSLLCQYDGTTDDIASQTTNSILIFGFVNDTVPAVDYDWKCRIRYVG